MEIFEKKVHALKEVLRGAGSLLVSYSGGVDSTVLAVAAKEALPGRMACAIIDSPLIPRSEIEGAIELAELLSLPCRVLKSGIMENEEFLLNKKDRCYTCKKEMSGLLLKEAARLGLAKVADGNNISDLSAYRPGFRALEEAGIIHPFIDAEMDKEDIRRLAREYELPISEKPSASCLASRIPYDRTLETKTLRQIEVSEDFIRSLGVRQVRVRKHGDIARIEVDPDDFAKIMTKRDRVSQILKENGFRYAALDLDGFVSGSLD